MARQLNVSGKISVEISIDTDGHVADAHLVKGSPVLGNGVVETVKKWRFRPFVNDGKPVRALAELSFEFSRL